MSGPVTGADADHLSLVGVDDATGFISGQLGVPLSSVIVCCDAIFVRFFPFSYYNFAPTVGIGRIESDFCWKMDALLKDRRHLAPRVPTMIKEIFHFDRFPVLVW